MFSPNDHIVLDNASMHRFEAGDVLVDWFARQNCWMVFTPTHPPEFNAAELVFSYIKGVLKYPPLGQIAQQDLPRAIFVILRNFSTADVQLLS